jgi:hypothetical protein
MGAQALACSHHGRRDPMGAPLWSSGGIRRQIRNESGAGHPGDRLVTYLESSGMFRTSMLVVDDPMGVSGGRFREF